MIKYYPTIYLDVMATGANAPILVRAVNSKNERLDLVIKILESERMNSQAFLKESIGSLLAHKLGISTPKACIAEISAEFAESQHGKSVYQRLKTIHRYKLQLREYSRAGTNYQRR